MTRNAEYYKRELEELLTMAKNDGYWTYVEAECWTDSRCCIAETVLDSIGITFSRRDTMDYATVNEELYEIGRA